MTTERITFAFDYLINYESEEGRKSVIEHLKSNARVDMSGAGLSGSYSVSSIPNSCDLFASSLADSPSNEVVPAKSKQKVDQ